MNIDTGQKSLQHNKAKYKGHVGFFPQSEELGEETEEDSGQKEEVSQAYLNLAGEDGEIDAYELRDILNAVFTRGQSTHSYVPSNVAHRCHQMSVIITTH